VAIRDALSRLPVTYAVALRLRECGVDDAVIAAALDVDREAIPTLLALAQAKLASLLADEQQLT
jgi:DNA-directed RNA polymerase specialized sigma24 family protein